MTPEELKGRTKEFAMAVLEVVDAMPNRISARVLANQVARSATSVAANYRSACKGRSKAEFIAKLGVAEEEADESQHWLEMIAEKGLAPAGVMTPLLRESRELTAILASSRRSASGGARGT
jgi:four helix bundle protein